MLTIEVRKLMPSVEDGTKPLGDASASNDIRDFAKWMCSKVLLLWKKTRDKIREIYESRNILHSLVRKSIEGRYKNSFLGIGWQLLTPIISVVLFYVVFTGVLDNNIEDYWVYLCVGMFPFSFMQSNLSGSGVIANNGSIINKIYFPREIIVLAQVLSSFIVTLIAYIFIISLMLISGHHFDLLAFLCLVPVTILTIMFTVGYTLLFSALTVFARDVEYFFVAISRAFFWVTPIFYMVDNMNDVIGAIVWFNPFTYFIECFHDCLYWATVPNLDILTMCLALAIIALLVGTYSFDKLKGKFAERI